LSQVLIPMASGSQKSPTERTRHPVAAIRELTIHLAAARRRHAASGHSLTTCKCRKEKGTGTFIVRPHPSSWADHEGGTSPPAPVGLPSPVLRRYSRTEYSVYAPAQLLQFANRHRLIDPLQPISRPWRRAGSEISGAFLLLPHFGARPLPSPRALHQSGSDRIAFNVTQHCQQMPILFNRKRLEPALPNVTAAVMMLMIAPHMGIEHPVHPTTQITVPAGHTAR
jgi:hypothetical protein